MPEILKKITHLNSTLISVILQEAGSDVETSLGETFLDIKAAIVLSNAR